MSQLPLFLFQLPHQHMIHHHLQLLSLRALSKVRVIPSTPLCCLQLLTYHCLHALLFTDKTPSDVGIKRILLHIPQWWDLAGMLGVLIDQVKAFHLEPVLGGDQALAYWRDGRCGERFPTTWRFLLGNVKELCGPQVAKKLREKVEKEETWSQ